MSTINISITKISSFNGCRNYVGYWSHLETAEKVCSEDFAQPWSGEKRSGAPSSRGSPLPGRLLCKHERYLYNKYLYICVISLTSLVHELLCPVLKLRAAFVPQESVQGLTTSMWNGLKMQSPQSLLCFQGHYSCSKLFTKLLKLRIKTGAYILFTL